MVKRYPMRILTNGFRGISKDILDMAYLHGVLTGGVYIPISNSQPGLQIEMNIADKYGFIMMGRQLFNNAIPPYISLQATLQLNADCIIAIGDGEKDSYKRYLLNLKESETHELWCENFFSFFLCNPVGDLSGGPDFCCPVFPLHPEDTRKSVVVAQEIIDFLTKNDATNILVVGGDNITLKTARDRILEICDLVLHSLSRRSQ